MQIKSINAEKRNAAYQEIVKKLDKLENECMPDAQVSSNQVTFEKVRYMIPSEQTIELENTGKVPTITLSVGSWLGFLSSTAASGRCPIPIHS